MVSPLRIRQGLAALLAADIEIRDSFQVSPLVAPRVVVTDALSRDVPPGCRRIDLTFSHFPSTFPRSSLKFTRNEGWRCLHPRKSSKLCECQVNQNSSRGSGIRFITRVSLSYCPQAYSVTIAVPVFLYRQLLEGGRCPCRRADTILPHRTLPGDG